MRRTLAAGALLTILAAATLASLSRAGQSAANGGTWTGWLTDDMCAEKGASPGHAACVKMCIAEHGARYALYDTAAKKLYLLDSSDKLGDHAGEQVIVQGKLEGHTIHVASIATKPGSGS